MAITIAIPYLTTDYVLIISSHAVIENPLALGNAMELLDSHPRLGGAGFSSHDHGEKRPHVVTANGFNGLNALWNSCSLSG